MNNVTKLIKINKEKKIAIIDYNQKTYEATIKYSISHGYYAEFFVCSNLHRLNIDKGLLE